MNSQTRARLLLESAAASMDERVLWEAVRGKHPGQPGHDEKAWEQWLAAANRVRHLGEQLQKLDD